ncbi:MAG: hypothetical protein KUG79_07500 [Pseudomonadales bacterium]|nr:hypothetical protein [Pseudomonadales bacterium]
MSKVVNLMGRGGQCFSESVLGWNRGTIRKSQREVLAVEIEQNQQSRYEGCRRLPAEHIPPFFTRSNKINC